MLSGAVDLSADLLTFFSDILYYILLCSTTVQYYRPCRICGLSAALAYPPHAILEVFHLSNFVDLLAAATRAHRTLS